MKNVLYALAITALAVVVSPSYGSEPSQSTSSAAKKGWVTIFDGKTFDGWRGYTRTDVPGLWTIEEGGVMKVNAPSDKLGKDAGDLIFDKKLKNFELELEWKSPKGGNSGLFYYAQEVPGSAIYTSAPEYQLGSVDGSGTVTKHGPASLFDMLAASPQNAKLPGEWNKAKIIVNNGKVEHYQNGVKVCEYTLWTPEWKALLDDSKFSEKNWPEAYKYQINVGGPNHEGYIGLQEHGSDFWFRNIKLKEL